MATTFHVMYLGTQERLDLVEGNAQSENASALVGKSFGETESPLYEQVQELSAVDPSSYSYGSDNKSGYYNQFTINGSDTHNFDCFVIYNATLTYDDGTTASFTANVIQTDTGETFLVPEFYENSDHAAMEAKPIVSLTLNSVSNDRVNLGADRADWEPMVPDGEFDGTSGNDFIEVGDIDADGDEVTDNADVINGGMGDDTIHGGGGDDTIHGGTGDDEIHGGDGNDELHGGRGDDLVSGGDGNDTIYAGAGDDTVDGGSGDDLIIGDSSGSSDDSPGGASSSEWTALHLGKAESIDPTGTGNWAEDADSIIGTWGSAGSPLDANQVRVSVDDADNDGRVDSDGDSNPEVMMIDGTAYTLDSAVVYSAMVTFEDGTTGMISAVVFQTTDGNLFLAPEMSYNDDAKLMESQPIQSIKLISVLTNNTSLASDRWDHGYIDSAEDGDDYIDAGADDDTVIGGGGDDTIIGGDGKTALMAVTGMTC